MQLRVFAVATVIAASGCNLYSDEGCQETLEKTMLLEEPADPPLQFRIDTCRIDSDACPPLCALAMQRQGLNGTPITCAVGFVSAGVRVRVSYSVPRNDSNCGVFADDVADDIGSGAGGK